MPAHSGSSPACGIRPAPDHQHFQVSDRLERIGDEATKIARRAIKLCEEGEAPRGYVEVRHIGDQVRNMVRDALDSFARFDAELALSVAQYDKTIDREYKTALRELATYMMEDPRSISRVLDIIWVLRSLERIGDHARNISELVIYGTRDRRAAHGSQAHEGRSAGYIERNR